MKRIQHPDSEQRLIDYTKCCPLWDLTHKTQCSRQWRPPLKPLPLPYSHWYGGAILRPNRSILTSQNTSFFCWITSVALNSKGGYPLESLVFFSLWSAHFSQKMFTNGHSLPQDSTQQPGYAAPIQRLPATFASSSNYLVEGLPTLRFTVRGCHWGTLWQFWKKKRLSQYLPSLLNSVFF